MADVVTIQLGSFSNFIGTHFWNIQHEQLNRDSSLTQIQQEDSTLFSGISSSTVFSEHQINRQTVYRPRLVIADVQGALGGISNDEITTIKNEPICWDGHVTHIDPHNYSSLSKHPYITYLDSDISSKDTQVLSQQIKTHQNFNFTSTVNYFSDFFTLDWESKRHTTFIPDYFYGGDPFSSFSIGRELTREEESDSFWQHVCDLIRLQLELSNEVGAIHLLVDWETGFGGVASGVVEWLAEQTSKTPIVIFATEPENDAMAEKTPQWIEGAYRRVGGGLFLKTCMEELGHDWNSLLVSDFNVSPLGCIPGQQHRLSLGQLDFKNLYESSALPGVALDLLSLPYRIEGATAVTAREMFETTSLNNHSKPFMSLHLGCPIASDLFPLERAKQSEGSLSLIERLWDLSFSPRKQPSCILKTSDDLISSLCQFAIGRGLTYDQEIGIVSQLKSPERRLCLPDPTPIPLAFPQFSKDQPKQSEISSLALLRPMVHPNQFRILHCVKDSMDRVLKFGRSATLQSHGDIEKSTLLDLSYVLSNMIHLDDRAMDFD